MKVSFFSLKSPTEVFLKVFFLIFAVCILSVCADKKSIRITGRMMCRGQPAQYVQLQILTKRLFTGQYTLMKMLHKIEMFSGNAIMAENVFTDPNGYFDIAGYVDQSSGVRGRFWVWHECFSQKYHKDPCKNWFGLNIPDEFVTGAALPRAVWPLGEVDLEDEQKKEYLDKCK